MTTRAVPVILVPLDGSELAEGALWVAARLARALRGMLRLVAVRSGAEDAEGVEAARDWRRYLSAMADEVATAHGTRCDSAVLQGWPPEAIAAHLATAGCRVVVMTAHGRTGASRSWIGSTTEGVLARVSIPVLVLRPEVPPHAPFQHVLVALDQTAAAARVLAQALLLAGSEAATTYALVRVVETSSRALLRRGAPLKPESAEGLERRRTEAAQALERAASRLRKRGVAVTTHVVTGRNVANRLIALGRTLACDAIVIGSQSPHAAPRLSLGKVADKVLRGAKQAVLVVPVARGRIRRPARGRRQRATATS